MNDLYVARAWAALERLVVSEACAGRLPVLAFPSPGAPTPDFALPLVNGPGVLRLRSLRGRIVVLDFWAIWCGPCLKKMPEYVRLANDYPSSVVVVGVVMQERPGSGDSPSRDPSKNERRWLTSHPPGRMIHVYDRNGDVERNYQIGGAGFSFLIDTLGNVMRSRIHRRSQMEVDELRGYLAQAAHSSVQARKR